ncbi:hypothetical protein ACJX0J_016561, partial [Zea mays]
GTLNLEIIRKIPWDAYKATSRQGLGWHLLVIRRWVQKCQHIIRKFNGQNRFGMGAWLLPNQNKFIILGQSYCINYLCKKILYAKLSNVWSDKQLLSQLCFLPIIFFQKKEAAKKGLEDFSK